MKYSYNVFFIILWGLFISCSSDDPAVDSNEGKDDKEIKLLKVYDGKKTVYHQILETLDDEAIELKIPNANAQYSYHKIVVTDDSDYNSVVDGYKAQNTVKKMIYHF